MNNIPKIRLVFLLATLLFCGFASGQEDQNSVLDAENSGQILSLIERNKPIGKIHINQDQRLNSLLRKHINYNDSIGMQGWKIIVYNGRELKRAQEAGALFNTTFPDLKMDYLVDYQAPDFKTFVGAFRTREEAYRFHQNIKSEFQFSYLVPATIKVGEFK